MLVEIKNIQKNFKGKQVLKGVSFSLSSGMCAGILGANGCGKSTLLSILAGVQKPKSGSFLCDGKDLFKQPSLHAQQVGYVPQGTPLMEELTAKDNLLLWYGAAEMKKELDSGVLAMLGIGAFLKTPVHKMSGGMKKRLSIGCAMAKHPPILLLDEATAALDLVCKDSIAAYLTRYKAQGGILLLTTHDMNELDLCDTWYVLKDGRAQPFVYSGDIHALIQAF